MKKKLYKFDIEEEEVSTQDINTSGKRKLNNKGPVFLFTIISLAIILFSGWYFYNGLNEPFELETPEWLRDFQNTDEQQAVDIVELRNKDTDHDGLNDFEEIYQYSTSVFLEDTDSDTYSDYEEVTTGNDPLCPAGEDCGLLRLITPKTKISEVISDTTIDPDVDLQTAVLADFRKALVEGGIPQEEVDKWTDEDLVSIYEAMSNITDVDDVTDTAINPNEVRNFLLAQPGVDEAQVNGLSDDELLEIGRELMGQAEDAENVDSIQ